MNQSLMDPLDYYTSTAKNEHDSNVKEYFGTLLEKSGVDENKNRHTVKLYKKENEVIDSLNKKITRFKVLKVFLIILSVIGGIGCVFGITLFSESVIKGVIWLVCGIALLVLGIVLCAKKINPMIKDFHSVLEKRVAKARDILNTAYEEMAPLNNLFDNTDTFRLIEKTVPDIKFNTYYNIETENCLNEKYGFNDLMNPNDSVLDTLSGTMCGNPFLFYKYRSCYMTKQLYEGFLTISWTETYEDSDGHSHTRTRTQTLTATVLKPKPEYSTRTALVYGSQTAPDLHFSREAAHTERLDEKDIERKVRKGEKDLREKAEEATVNGGSFQEMANSEFDVLFGATNRDHEVQFRVMYTPLAQQNTVEILKNKVGYGDDFSFRKCGRYNILRSEHAQTWNMDTSVRNYQSYDVDAARKNYIDFNNNYFRSVFFDLAPLMAIPAYLEEPSFSLDPPEDYSSNYTSYEHQSLANAIGYDAFAANNSQTEAIIKTDIIGKDGKNDIVGVTAHSFLTESRVDFVPVWGGDGHLHNVPVPWIEYIPVSNSKEMVVKALDMSEKQFRERADKKEPSQWAFLHSMMAYVR